MLYEQLNPNWVDEDDKAEPILRIKKHPPAQPGPTDEYIDITSTPPASGETATKASSAPPPPGRRDRGANHIPDLVIGIGEYGR